MDREKVEEKSRFKEFNGIKTKEYLDKARSMFVEMDLQWDLDQLERMAVDPVTEEGLSLFLNQRKKTREV